MTDMEQHDKDLEAFFAAGRAEAPVPSDDLIARILADAAAERPQPAPIAASTLPKRGVLAGLFADIGGWRAAAGLGFAGLVGLWVGYSVPTVLDPATTVLGGYDYEVADLAITADAFWSEG